MRNSNFQKSISIINELFRHGVKTYFISPGMRCAPFIYALEDLQGHLNLNLISVIDERTSAFAALGASLSGIKSACVCTSGTAGAHFLPAIIEASEAGKFFVAITADRPGYLRGTFSNQTIDQIELYSKYADFFNFSFESKEAYLEISFKRPMHLNLEFDEPLLIDSRANVKDVSFKMHEKKQNSEKDLSKLEEILREIKRPLILISGEREIAPGLSEVIKRFPHYFEITNDLFWEKNENSIDLETFIKDIRSIDSVDSIDGIIHIGNKVISQNYYRWLKSTGVREVLICSDDEKKVNSDFCQLQIFNSKEVQELIKRVLKNKSLLPGDKYKNTLNQSHFYRNLLETLADFNTPIELFLGNSSIIRDVNGLQIDGGKKIKVRTTRGVSGIDGSFAIVAGMKVARDNLVLGVIGDIAALHDLGSYYHFFMRTNAKMIVVDNGGGEIFRRLSVAKSDLGLSTFIETPTPVDLEKTFQIKLKTANEVDRKQIKEFLCSRGQLMIVRVDS